MAWTEMAWRGDVNLGTSADREGGMAGHDSGQRRGSDLRILR